MTRDMRWKVTGVVLCVAACCVSVAVNLSSVNGSPLTVLCFLVATAGIVLMIGGKRVGTFWRAERRRHSETAAAVHARRHRRAD